MSIYQERAKECKCCGKHVPLPTVLKEYNGTPLCPTTFSNVVEYKRIWKSSGSRPMGSVRKHFSPPQKSQNLEVKKTSLDRQRKYYIGEDVKSKKRIVIDHNFDLFNQSKFALPNVLLSPRESRLEHINNKKKSKLHKKIIRDVRLPGLGSSFI